MIYVFDIDDTLYLERDYIRSGFRAVGDWAVDRFGIDGLDDRCWSLFEEGHRGTIFNSVLAEIGISTPDSVLSEAVDVYRSHDPDIQLLPDTRWLLRELSSQGAVGLAAISDGPLRSQQQKAKALGLRQWIPEILLTDQWGRDYWKPHPRAFAEVERVFKASPSDCVYVADNPVKDFTAPQQRGWQTIRIRRMGGIHCGLPSSLDSPPDAEIASLAELLSSPVDMK